MGYVTGASGLESAVNQAALRAGINCYINGKAVTTPNILQVLEIDVDLTDFSQLGLCATTNVANGYVRLYLDGVSKIANNSADKFDVYDCSGDTGTHTIAVKIDASAANTTGTIYCIIGY